MRWYRCRCCGLYVATGDAVLGIRKQCWACGQEAVHRMLPEEPRPSAKETVLIMQVAKAEEVKG